MTTRATLINRTCLELAEALITTFWADELIRPAPVKQAVAAIPLGGKPLLELKEGSRELERSHAPSLP